MSAAASLPHDAARQHVSGSARYVDDIPTPQGTLHLAFGLSSCAAGQTQVSGSRCCARLPRGAFGAGGQGSSPCQ
jgi:xanthine dehydrogenase large subunit